MENIAGHGRNVKQFNDVTSTLSRRHLSEDEAAEVRDTPAEQDSKPAETAWRRWSPLYGKDLLGIIPPKAETAPRLQKNRGKIPGYKKPDGTWCGRSQPLSGPEAATTREEIKQWARDHAGIGIMGRTCPGLDNDASNERIR